MVPFLSDCVLRTEGYIVLHVVRSRRQAVLCTNMCCQHCRFSRGGQSEQGRARHNCGAPLGPFQRRRHSTHMTVTRPTVRVPAFLVFHSGAVMRSGTVPERFKVW